MGNLDEDVYTIIGGERGYRDFFVRNVYGFCVGTTTGSDRRRALSV